MDERLDNIIEAANQLIEGKYRLQLSLTGEDQVARLGRALESLGRLLEYRFEEMRMLSRVTEKINSGVLLDEVLNFTYESFQPLIPYDRIGFALLEDEGKTLKAYWARSEAPELKIYKGYSAPLAGSSLQEILVTGRPRILNDLEAYLAAHPGSDSTRRIVEEGIRSSLTCPLMANGRSVGFIFFSHRAKDTYRHAHVELFREIAGQLALIVEKGRMYQQLLELNELKNNFLGIVAHDLRNPLTVIKGNLDLMDQGFLGDLSEPQRKAVAHMRAYTKTMLLLVTDLLDVSAIESGHLTLRPRDVDLASYMRGCVEFNNLAAQAKSIELRLEEADPLPVVRMDPDRMNQVLNNLISNAVKFSAPQTTVTVRVQVSGEMLKVAVQDQGQGIPQEEQSRLFKFFGRTSVASTKNEPSTGLGLAIVKRIIEAHGGSISVESRVGEGSTFSFCVPVR